MVWKDITTVYVLLKQFFTHFHLTCGIQRTVCYKEECRSWHHPTKSVVLKSWSCANISSERETFHPNVVMIHMDNKACFSPEVFLHKGISLHCFFFVAAVGLSILAYTQQKALIYLWILFLTQCIMLSTTQICIINCPFSFLSLVFSSLFFHTFKTESIKQAKQTQKDDAVRRQATFRNPLCNNCVTIRRQELMVGLSVIFKPSSAQQKNLSVMHNYPQRAPLQKVCFLQIFTLFDWSLTSSKFALCKWSDPHQIMCLFPFRNIKVTDTSFQQLISLNSPIAIFQQSICLNVLTATIIYDQTPLVNSYHNTTDEPLKEVKPMFEGCQNRSNQIQMLEDIFK